MNFHESQIVVDLQNWPMKQRHNVQSITFIFVSHCESGLEIVFRDLLDVDRVLPSKIHAKNSGRYTRVFFPSKDTEDCQNGEQSQIP